MSSQVCLYNFSEPFHAHPWTTGRISFSAVRASVNGTSRRRPTISLGRRNDYAFDSNPQQNTRKLECDDVRFGVSQ